MNIFKERTPEFEAKRIAGVKRALKGHSPTEQQRKARHEGLLKAWREGRCKAPVMSPELRKILSERRRGVPRPPHVIEALRRANTGRIVSAKTRAKMSENTRSHIAKFGPNPKSIKAFEAYRKTPEFKAHCLKIATDPKTREAVVASLRGRKWSDEIVKKRTLPMLGRPQVAEATRKGPSNVNSLEGALRDACGRIFRFRNLSHFVRTHEELFDAEDLIMKGSHGKEKRQRSCNAIKRLLCLFGHGKVVPGTWKGWTRVSHYEHVKMNDGDPIGRQ